MKNPAKLAIPFHLGVALVVLLGTPLAAALISIPRMLISAPLHGESIQASQFFWVPYQYIDPEGLAYHLPGTVVSLIACLFIVRYAIPSLLLLTGIQWFQLVYRWKLSADTGRIINQEGVTIWEMAHRSLPMALGPGVALLTFYILHARAAERSGTPADFTWGIKSRSAPR